MGMYNLFIYLFIYLFVYLFIYLYIYLFIYFNESLILFTTLKK